jgi:hypothetical protein
MRRPSKPNYEVVTLCASALMLPPILVAGIASGLGVAATVWLGAGMLLALMLATLIAKD